MAGALILAAALAPNRRPGPGLVAGALVAASWLAAILAGALILAPVAAGVWVVALGTAFIIWVGFVAPALALTAKARGARWGASLADTGVWLVAMLVMAAILRLVGLSAPG